MANYFFGLKPTEDSLLKILDYSSELKNLFTHADFSFTDKNNLHLTLLFLGKLKDEQVKSAKNILRELFSVKKNPPFSSLNQKALVSSAVKNLASSYSSNNLFTEFLEALYLGEPPRLVCLSGKASFAILNLKRLLEKEAMEKNLLLEGRAKKNFLPHITLLRFPPTKKTLPPLPKLSPFTCSFEAPALFTRQEQENGYYYLKV